MKQQYYHTIMETSIFKIFRIYNKNSLKNCINYLTILNQFKNKLLKNFPVSMYI